MRTNGTWQDAVLKIDRDERGPLITNCSIVALKEEVLGLRKADSIA
jgi:hypothetical protein